MSRAALAVVCAAVALVGTACAGGEAPPVDLPSAGGPSSTSGATPAPETPDASLGSSLPTVGLPSQARAELRDVGDADPGAVAAWKAYREALAESLRAHRPTAELRDLASDDVVAQVTDRAASDADAGLTVGLRPLGRLRSATGSEGSVDLLTCLWAPSVGFFVEADGRAAEGAAPGWVEQRTVLRGGDGRWTVTGDRPTGDRCSGGAP